VSVPPLCEEGRSARIRAFHLRMHAERPHVAFLVTRWLALDLMVPLYLLCMRTPHCIPHPTSTILIIVCRRNTMSITTYVDSECSSETPKTKRCGKLSLPMTRARIERAPAAILLLGMHWAQARTTATGLHLSAIHPR